MMKEKIRQWLLALCCFVTAGLVLSAFLIQFSFAGKESVGLRAGGVGMFRMFTNDGNLFTAAVALICGIYSVFCAITGRHMNSRVIYSLRLMSAVSETVIFLIVVAILMPMGMKALLSGYSMIALHAAVPLMTAASFIVLDPRPAKLSRTAFLFGSLPVFLYGLIVLVLCFARVWTGSMIPYPFFRVYDNPAGLTFAAMAAIVGVTLLLSFALDRIGRVKRERRSVSGTNGSSGTD